MHYSTQVKLINNGPINTRPNVGCMLARELRWFKKEMVQWSAAPYQRPWMGQIRKHLKMLYYVMLTCSILLDRHQQTRKKATIITVPLCALWQERWDTEPPRQYQSRKILPWMYVIPTYNVPRNRMGSFGLVTFQLRSSISDRPLIIGRQLD